MKFDKTLSLLALAITVNGAVIPANLNAIQTEECQETFKLFEKCVLLVDPEDDGKPACSVFETPTCQQFYKNYDAELFKCQFNPDDVVTSEFVEHLVQDYSAVCVKDEEGQYCPLAAIVTGSDLNGYIIDEDKSEEQILAEIYSLNCASELCREATISFIEDSRETLKKINAELPYNDDTLVDNINNLNNLIASLETLSCRSGQVSSNVAKDIIAEDSSLEEEEELDEPENGVAPFIFDDETTEIAEEPTEVDDDEVTEAAEEPTEADNDEEATTDVEEEEAPSIPVSEDPEDPEEKFIKLIDLEDSQEEESEKENEEVEKEIVEAMIAGIVQGAIVNDLPEILKAEESAVEASEPEEAPVQKPFIQVAKSVKIEPSTANTDATTNANADATALKPKRKCIVKSAKN